METKNIKKKENISFALQVGLAALLPWICCVLYCLLQGKTVGQVYLPCSEWNDELFYYKQVEGIVKYGYPLGYFGFNESHAISLSFAAWSPVLVFPWIIWGKIFGWGLLSPIICNLFWLSASMVIFVLTAKPDWKQEGILGGLFCLFTPFVRYLLSGMPEIICFGMLIVFYGLSINEIRQHKAWKLIVLLFMGVLLTLMRPYLILFLFLPCYLWIRQSVVAGIVGSIFVSGGALGGYALIKHYLGAEYFADLFFTDWIKAFFERGIFGGARYTLGKLYYMGKDFMIHLIEGFRSGMASGAFFAGFLAVGGILALQTYFYVREIWKNGKSETKEEKNEPALVIVTIHLLCSFVGMFFALLLMYKLTEGSKHLLTFIAIGIFIVSLYKTKYYRKAFFLGLVFLYFYLIMARSAYDYQVPFATDQRKEQIAFWQERMTEKLTLDTADAPSYDNVIIWVLYDRLQDGKQVNIRWQLLYALPKGLGISCCKEDFIQEHLEKLQSKYIATISGGDIDKKLSQIGKNELIRDEDMVIYQLR